MEHVHFFHRQELPWPGSEAQPVTYPVCEWRPPEAAFLDVHKHPLNRFVCSWLTSDMTDVARCDEVLAAIRQLENQHLSEWFVDGEMFCVALTRDGVQFNQSNVGPEDVEWWNLPEGRFTLAEVHALLQLWRNFLVRVDGLG